MREYKDIRFTLGNKDVITAVNILNISTLKLNIFFSEIDQRYYHFIYKNSRGETKADVNRNSRNPLKTKLFSTEI